MEAEERYLRANLFNPEDYEVVTWSDGSQDYIGYTEDDDVHLINDEKGLKLFGSSAYIIPKGLEAYDDFQDEMENMSEDEVRDLCCVLNENVKDLTAHLDVTQKTIEEAVTLLVKAKDILDLTGFEGELMGELDNFIREIQTGN